MPFPPPVIVGSRSRAEQAPDGTWTIRDVPLFGEMTYVDDETGERIPVDKPWLERAVGFAQAGYASNEYLPQLHVNHHDLGNDQVEPAGTFLPQRVGRARTRDGEVWAVFGDLVGVYPEIYERIRQKRLKYLSCEAKMRAGRLESCALLATRPPVHKFTPLTIGQETRTKFRLRSPEAVVAFSSSGVAARVLCRIPTPMSDPKKDGEEAPKPNADGAPPATPPAAPPAETVPAWAQALLDGVKAIGAMLAKLVAEPEDDTPGQPVPAGGSASTAFADVQKELGALRGTVEGLTTKQASRDKADKDRGEVDAVEKRLSKYADAPARAKLAEVHKKGGNEALVAYADAIEPHLSVDPTRSTLDAQEHGGQAVLHKDLAKFADRGPDDTARVMRLSAKFDSLGGEAVLGMKRVAYVDAYLRAEQDAA